VAIGWNAETQTRSELEGFKVWQWVECYGLGWGLGGGLRCDFVHRWRIIKVGADMAKKAYSSLFAVRFHALRVVTPLFFGRLNQEGSYS